MLDLGRSIIRESEMPFCCAQVNVLRCGLPRTGETRTRCNIPLVMGSKGIWLLMNVCTSSG